MADGRLPEGVAVGEFVREALGGLAGVVGG